MRRFANGSFVCLVVVVAVFVAPACVQADTLTLKLDMGYTGQAVASGWSEFSCDQGVASASNTYGAVTVTVTSAAGDLEPRNRAAVTYSDPPGDVLRDNISSNDSTLTLSMSGLTAGTYTMTTWLHEAQYGGDGRISPTVTLNDVLGATVVGTNVYYTKGFSSPFSYELVNKGTDYYQAAPSSLTFGITANGVDPISLVFAGGSYQGYNTTPVVSGIVLTQLTETPEPSTIILLGTGLLGLLAYAWRKRK